MFKPFAKVFKTLVKLIPSSGTQNITPLTDQLNTPGAIAVRIDFAKTMIRPPARQRKPWDL